MQRRKFVTTSIAAAALGVSGASRLGAAAPAETPREFYELRKYRLANGPQMALTENYIGSALIPALNRQGIGPVGAFYVTIGPETPTLYVLIPGSNLQTLVTSDLLLAADPVFMKAAEPFWNAPAIQPPYDRIESSLMAAFQGWPKLTAPANKEKRIFQLRIYESSTNQDHVRKVEMFHHGEFEIFARAGFSQVFYGDSLIGPRLPNLTYMLTFPDMAALEASWQKFTADPQWQKLKSDPRYAFEQIVSNITNLILTPAPFSQI